MVVKTADRVVGHWPTAGYEFDASKARVPGQALFVGLGIDEDQQPALSAERLNRWCRQIHDEFGLATPVVELDD